jgi:hypothetical protein
MKKSEKNYITTSIMLTKEDYVYLQERVLELKKNGLRDATISGYLRYLISKDKQEVSKN